MGLEEYKGVFVFAQQVDNVLDGVAFELLGKGKELAKDLNTEVTAVLIGSGVKDIADNCVTPLKFLGNLTLISESQTRSPDFFSPFADT